MSESIDPLGRVTSTEDLLGKVRGFLSGFMGYVERDRRREADKLLRQAVAARYEEQWARISELQRRLVNEGRIQWLGDLETAAIKLRTLIDRAKTASYGYAGLFDHVRIGEQELARLYQYDLTLLENVSRVAGAVERVAADLSEEALPESVRALQQVCGEVLEAFNRRQEVLLTSGASDE